MSAISKVRQLMVSLVKHPTVASNKPFNIMASVQASGAVPSSRALDRAFSALIKPTMPSDSLKLTRMTGARSHGPGTPAAGDLSPELRQQLLDIASIGNSRAFNDGFR